MTTSRALTCPVCRIPLTELSVEDTSIFLPVCSGCGGTWLDIARSQRVVRGLISRAERALAAHASGTRQSPPRADGERVCADCGGPLAQTVLKDVGITLDACSAHGTWFDATELVAVSDAFALKAASDDADAAQFGRELAEDRRERAAGGISSAARILGRLLR